MPKISVIMPVYNGERYLKGSIDSILSQTFGDFEFIIVNDGSTDGTEEIILSYKDPRIKYYKKSNSGIVDSLNLALEHSIGEYVARMDADDISERSRLEVTYNYCIEHEIVLLGTYAKLIDENGTETGELTYSPLQTLDIRRYSLLHNPFIHSSVLIKRSIFDEVGKYKKLYKHVEDYELWTRVIYKYKCENLPQELLEYRIHSKQITKRFNFKMRLIGLLVRMLALVRYIKS